MEHVITNAQTGEVLVVPFTIHEILAYEARALESAWVTLRDERNLLLKESDPNVVMDRWETYTEETRQAWRDYRQALRDLPSNTSDPFNVVWPSKPME